ncbi:hypothetical protein ACQJBY_068467 [Aegilops geniculata]
MSMWSIARHERTGSNKCEHWLGVLRRMTLNGSMRDTVVQEIRGNPVVSTMLSEILCSQGDSFRFLHDEQRDLLMETFALGQSLRGLMLLTI